MKAVRFHLPKIVKVDELDMPKIQEPTDVIIKVTSAAICGSDLHITKDQALGPGQAPVHRYIDDLMDIW